MRLVQNFEKCILSYEMSVFQCEHITFLLCEHASLFSNTAREAGRARDEVLLRSRGTGLLRRCLPNLRFLTIQTILIRARRPKNQTSSKYFEFLFAQLFFELADRVFRKKKIAKSGIGKLGILQASRFGVASFPARDRVGLLLDRPREALA